MIRSQRRSSGRPLHAVKRFRFLGLLGVFAGLLVPSVAAAQGGPKGARPTPTTRPQVPRTRGAAQLPSPAAVNDEEPSEETGDEPSTVVLSARAHLGGAPVDVPGALQTLRAPADPDSVESRSKGA